MPTSEKNECQETRKAPTAKVGSNGRSIRPGARAWRGAREMHRAGAVPRPGEERPLAERVGMRIRDADARPAVAGDRVVLAVDDVADAADRESETHPRRARVGTFADRDAATDRGDEAAKRAEDRGAPDRDAAGPDLRDEQWIAVVAARAPAVDDVYEARADDPGDDRDRRDAVERVLAYFRAQEPHREPDAEEDPDRREDAVPGEGDGAQVDVRVEGNVDQRTSGAGGRSPPASVRGNACTSCPSRTSTDRCARASPSAAPPSLPRCGRCRWADRRRAAAVPAPVRRAPAPAPRARPARRSSR